MAILRSTLLALPLLLTGCAAEDDCDGASGVSGGAVSVGAVTEDNYVELAAKSTCENMRTCNPISFHVDPDDIGVGGDEADQYPEGDMDACLATFGNYYDDQKEHLMDADCVLDEGAATVCFSPGTCEEQAENIRALTEACEMMWEC